MANLNKPVCLLDSDVLLNWLAQEEDPVAKLILWDAPHKIMRLMETNGLQEEYPLSPMDAVILGVLSSMKDRNVMFITRDKDFTKISKTIAPTFTPEDFLKKLK